MAIRVISSDERQSRRPQTSVAQRVTRRFRSAARRERRCVPGAATRYAIAPGARNAACVTLATGCYAQQREFAAVSFACEHRFLLRHRTSSLACLSSDLTGEARNTARHDFVALALNARCRVRHTVRVKRTAPRPDGPLEHSPRSEKCRLGQRFDVTGERFHSDPKNVRLVERIVMLLSVVHRVALKLALLQNDVACGMAGGGRRCLS